MNVIDKKLPELLKDLNDKAGSSHMDQISQVNTKFETFETKEKARLYRLIPFIAEKNSHVAMVQTGRSSVGSETIHLKKTDPPTFSGKEEDYPEIVASNCGTC